MAEITATDWAYLAGFIDGEGSIVLSHRGDRSLNSYECCVSVYNTDKRTLDWIQDIFGGHMYLDERGLKPGNRFGRKPINRLAWHGKADVGRILKGVIPYMLTKYEVAEAILNFVETPLGEKEIRKMFYSNFKEIKEEVHSDGR